MPSTASGTAFRIAARTCSSLGRTASGWAAMYSSTELGTPDFILLILRFDTLWTKPRGAPMWIWSVVEAKSDKEEPHGHQSRRLSAIHPGTGRMVHRQRADRSALPGA